MTIYGECETREKRMAVRITDLGRSGCALSSAGRDMLPDGEMTLWIGAIGPILAIAMQNDASRASAAFKQPLDPRILNHFTHQ